MAIQIPKLTVAPETASPEPRLDTPHLDVATPMQKQQGALEGATKDAIRLHQEIQHQEADTTATNKSNDFLIWRKKRLYGDPDNNWEGYANMTGANPQDLYRQFDKEQSDKLDSLAKPGKDEDWSNETQNLVNRRLSRHFEETQLETLTQYSRQKNKWDEGVSDTRKKLAQQAMYGSSSFIDPADKSSFGPLEANISQIRNAAISQGLINRGAVYDENGDVSYNDGSGAKSVKLTQQVKLKIAEDIAKGIDDVSTNLLNTKELDKAKALHDWANENGYLDVVTKHSINDKMQKAQFKHDAYALVDDARKRGSAVLDNVTDPELRHEAKKLFNEEERYSENTKDRRFRANYEVGSKRVDDVMNSATPFPGVLAMKDDPIVASVWADMSSKQQQALEHRVSAPRETAPAVRENWLNILSGKVADTTVRGMSVANLTANTAGMKEAERKEAVATWKKLNTQSDPQLEHQYNMFGKEFDQQAVGAQLVRKLPNSNFLVASDQIRAQQMKQKLYQMIDGLGPTSPSEVKKYVSQFVADEQANQIHQPFKSLAPKLNGGSKPAPAAAVSGAEAPVNDVSKIYGILTPAARMKFILDYRKANNNHAPDEKQLIEFIGKQTAGSH